MELSDGMQGFLKLLGAHMAERRAAGEKPRHIAADYDLSAADERSLRLRGKLTRSGYSQYPIADRLFDRMLLSAGFRKPRIRVKMGRKEKGMDLRVGYERWGDQFLDAVALFNARARPDHAKSDVETSAIYRVLSDRLNCMEDLATWYRCYVDRALIKAGFWSAA